MYKSCIYIVGDSYKDFAALEDVYTYTEALELVQKNSNLLNSSFIVIGQGINSKEKQALRTLELKNQIGFILNRHHELVPQKMSHKAKVHNTMISAPRVMQEKKQFSAYLMLDDDCAEMSDHTTGMHIQGMIITEAARQMMLAVGEKYLLSTRLQGNAYFALRQVNSKFYQFGFPIEVKLVHEVKKIKQRVDTSIAETTTQFIQNGILLAEVDIDYVACLKESLSSKESLMASNAVMKGKQNNIFESYVEMYV